ncbi:hypothetical protein U1Q18_013071 [Sarracenia purpurea var. burkii]
MEQFGSLSLIVLYCIITLGDIVSVDHQLEDLSLEGHTALVELHKCFCAWGLRLEFIAFSCTVFLCTTFGVLSVFVLGVCVWSSQCFAHPQATAEFKLSLVFVLCLVFGDASTELAGAGAAILCCYFVLLCCRLVLDQSNKTKEMWSYPLRPRGFWPFDRHNAQLFWDPHISQIYSWRTWEIQVRLIAIQEWQAGVFVVWSFGLCGWWVTAGVLCWFGASKSFGYAQSLVLLEFGAARVSSLVLTEFLRLPIFA